MRDISATPIFNRFVRDALICVGLSSCRVGGATLLCIALCYFAVFVLGSRCFDPFRLCCGLAMGVLV